MIIQKVTLTNFKCHTHLEVELTTGTNIITGENGVGKSSIVDAIGIALFDSKEGSLKEMVQQGVSYATIKIDFLLNGSNCTVVRDIGSSSNNVLFIDGQKVAEGREAVFTVLKENYDTFMALGVLFESIVCVRQKHLTYMLDLNTSQRKQLFNVILGVDGYNKLWERLKEVISYTKDRMHTLELELESVRGDIRLATYQLEANSLRITTLKEKLEEHEQLITMLNGYDFSKFDIPKLKSINEDLAILNLNTANQKLEQIARDMAEWQELSNVQETYEDELRLYNDSLEIWNKLQAEYRDALAILKNQQSAFEQDSRRCVVCGNELDEESVNETMKENLKQQKKYEGLLILPFPHEKPIDYSVRIEELEFNITNQEYYEKQRDIVEAELTFIKAFPTKEYEQLLAQAKATEQSLLKLDGEIEYLQKPSATSNLEGLESKETEVVNTLEKEEAVMAQAQKVRAEIKEYLPYITNTLKHEIIELAGLYWDEDFVVMLNGITYPNLSGGEKSRVALALRKALSQKLSPLEFLILDEPTDSLDRKKKGLINDGLSEFTNIKQFIIISHDESFSADNRIEL